MKKALVVRPSSIGDVVHALPVLAALGQAGWSAGWIVEPPARPLLEGGPVDPLVGVPPRRAFSWRGARQALAALRAASFDVALDLSGLWKSAAWARLSGARRVVGYARIARREPASALLLHEGVPKPEGVSHVIDLNLALLSSLGIDAVGLREFPLPPLASAEAAVAAWLDPGPEGVAVLNPGGGWRSKLWPPERFGALARLLSRRGIASVVTWGPGEEWLAQRVVASAEGAARQAPETTLLEMAALARRARVLVAADTGPLHLACAVGAPVVGLYGPTDPARNGPFAQRDRVVRQVPPCAPCHSRSCAIHAGVMESIEVDAVAAAVEQRLEAA